MIWILINGKKSLKKFLMFNVNLVQLNGCKSWTVTSQIPNKMLVFANKYLRSFGSIHIRKLCVAEPSTEENRVTW